jgi:beta-glucuronidase
MAYEAMSLNGEWNYIVDVQEEGYYDYRMNPMRNGFFINAKPKRPEDLIEYDFDKSDVMEIPSDWNTKDQRLFFYEGTVWFKKSFQAVPMKDYKTLLYFGAVNYDCHVWVNGKKAGHHVGGFTAFNYDISDLLVEGENTVIVKVDNKRHADAVPTLIFDWWNYGGITRDVKLVKVPKVYLEDYSLQLVKSEGVKNKYRQICFSAKLSQAEIGHQVLIHIPELQLKQLLTADAEGQVHLGGRDELEPALLPEGILFLDRHGVSRYVGHVPVHRFLLAAKNSWSSATHSSCNTPGVTSNVWFSRSSSLIRYSVPSAPAFGSYAPNTHRSMRA